MKMTARKYSLPWLIGVLCLGVQAVAQPLGLEDAKLILVHADILATARVGYEAAVSDKGWALNYILRRSSNPGKDFKEIFNSADSVYGKLYAVVGLLEITGVQNKYEDELLRVLRQQNVKILEQQGDLLDWVYIGDVVDQLCLRDARSRMFVIDGAIDTNALVKTSGKAVYEMGKAVENEALKAKQRVSQPPEE